MDENQNWISSAASIHCFINSHRSHGSVTTITRKYARWFCGHLTLGWLLGTIGATIPFIKNFGGPAILSLLVPSILVFFNLVNPNILESADILMK